jgi:hypothetical protein
MNLVLLLLGIYTFIAALVLLSLTVLCILTEKTWAGAWMVAGVSVQQMIRRSLAWPHTAYLLVRALRSAS